MATAGFGEDPSRVRCGKCGSELGIWFGSDERLSIPGVLSRHGDLFEEPPSRRQLRQLVGGVHAARKRREVKYTRPDGEPLKIGGERKKMAVRHITGSARIRCLSCREINDWNPPVIVEA